MGIHADLYPQPWLNCCLLLSCKKCSLWCDPCLNVYVYHGCPLSTQNIEKIKKKRFCPLSSLVQDVLPIVLRAGEIYPVPLQSDMPSIENFCSRNYANESMTY